MTQEDDIRESPSLEFVISQDMIDKKNEIMKKKLEYQRMMMSKNLSDDNKRAALAKAIDKLDQ